MDCQVFLDGGGGGGTNALTEQAKVRTIGAVIRDIFIFRKRRLIHRLFWAK